MVGAFAGFWIGFLGRIVVGATPVSGTAVLVWGVAGAALVALLGAMFPKLVSVALFPLATFGTS